MNWFLKHFLKICERRGTYKLVLFFFIESCRIQRYIILFLNPETLGFQKNTMRICPYDWYQLAKFWLLADRQRVQFLPVVLSLEAERLGERCRA